MAKLTYYDRQQIEHFLRLELGVRDIAEKIGRDHSVVSRELARNASPFIAYTAAHAQYFSERRARKTNRSKLAKHESLRIYVTEKITERWSPQQIAGRLKNHPPPEAGGLVVSYESIYKWIYDEENGEPRLYHKLRRRHPSRQKHGSRRRRKTNIPEKVSIHERPSKANERIEFGHWEADSMVGKGHKSGLSVQAERVTRYCLASKVQGFSATETKEAIESSILLLPQGAVKSFTFDNGTETAEHYKLREPYQIQTYHADAYCPWQKGTVENTIGLLRDYYPKKTDLREVPDVEIRAAIKSLNGRPRKVLGYQTPKEVLSSYIKSGALNP